MGEGGGVVCVCVGGIIDVCRIPLMPVACCDSHD